MLPTHSLCRYAGMETPQYKVTHWANDEERIRYGKESLDLGLVMYQTPGHTRDELTVWDEKERVLFVGDTAYEWAPIIFPLEGNIPLYKKNVYTLLNLVLKFNIGCNHNGKSQQIIGIARSLIGTVLDSPATMSGEKLPFTTMAVKRASMASGHNTSDTDAEEFLSEVYEFLCTIERGEVESRAWRHFRGEDEVLFERPDGKISFAGSKMKFLEFMRKPEVSCCQVL
jgi:hypothetical protein